MSAREIIADTHIVVPIGNASVSGRIGEAFADRVLTRLEAAGYRLIPPGQLDRETIEKCIEVIQEGEEVPDPLDDGRSTRMESWRDEDKLIAAIRALGAEK